MFDALRGPAALLLSAVLLLAPAAGPLPAAGPAGLLGAGPVPALAAPEPAPEESEPIYASPDLGPGTPAPEPAAEAWIVTDLDSGEAFAAHEIDAGRAPASVIKLLTALALVEVLDDPEQVYEPVFEDMAVDGTKAGIVQQNAYTVDDLFHAMLMSSANDAAHALGNAVGGQDEAVRLMNAKAAELGLTGTVARNTSGLDAEGQVTTVADQMIVARAVLRDDYLMGILRTETYDFPGATDPDTGEKVAGYEIGNHTRVVGEVDGGLGLKNGYTEAAKGSFVAVVERDGKTYASAVLTSDNGTRRAALDLIEWAFNQDDPEPVAEVRLTPEPTAGPTPTESTAAPAADVTGGAEASDSGAFDARILFAAAGAVLLLGAFGFVLLRRRSTARAPHT